MSMTKKAFDVVVMDLRTLSSVADYFVICSGDSDIQVKAIADAVEEGLEKKGVSPWHREAGSRNWLVLDYVDVVLHVFHKNTRAFYSLEKLWGDAVIKRLGDDVARTAKRATGKRRASKTRTAVKRKAS
jgi:ribosome-associated protein